MEKSPYGLSFSYQENDPFCWAIENDCVSEFVRFCGQEILTLEDVLNNKYQKEELKTLSDPCKYATALNLSKVDEENFKTARDFLKENFDENICDTFDLMWAYSNLDRVKILMREKKQDKNKQKIKK